MITTPEAPAFRRDLEVLAQAAPGKPDRHIIRDPRSGNVLELTGKEAFLCRQLDGVVSLTTIRSRFQETYKMDVDLKQLEAFVFQLQDCGLLYSSPLQPAPTTWQTMKRLPFPSSRWLSTWAGRLKWCFGWRGTVTLMLLSTVTLGILGTHWDRIVYELKNIFQSIVQVGQMGSLSAQGFLRIVMVIIILPFVSAIAKSLACRHFGFRVPEIRYLWYMRFIPRCASDVTAIGRIEEKGGRLRVAAWGFYSSVFVFALSTIFYEVLGPSNAAKDVAFSIALGAAISLVLNAVPFGTQDGSLLLTIWLDRPNLRTRAIKVFRAAIFFRPRPEPLTASEHRLFVLYGMLCELWGITINVLLLSLVGYLLIHWIGGVGAVLFAAILLLRFEDDLRKFLMSISPLRWLNERVLRNRIFRIWILRPLILVVAVVLFLLPYPYEISGEFRVQPSIKREVRAEVAAQIESILVDEGEWVTAGQPIVRLSKRLIQRNLDMARASLEEEAARLRELEAGTRPEQIAIKKQQVELAATALKHSERKLARAKDLYDKKHISDQDYDDALKQRDIDLETHELAQRDLELFEAGQRQEDIDAQKAVVKRLEVEVAHVEEDLVLTDIKSPVDGKVTTLYIKNKVGQQADIGSVLAVIEDNTEALIRIAMPEEYAGEIRKGAKVRIRAWAFAGMRLEGEVLSVTPFVVERTEDVIKEAHVEEEAGMVRNLNMPEDQVFIVLAQLPNQDGLLKSEMTGFAKIQAEPRPLGLALLDPVIRFFQVRVWSWIP